MRNVQTKKGYNQLPIDNITDQGFITFVAALQLYLQRHQQQNYDDINNLQTLELIATADLPVASASMRGKIVVIDGGVGVADVLKICVKKADETYTWKVVTIT